MSLRLDKSVGSWREEMERRLAEIEGLKANWDHEGAPAIDRRILEAARRLVAQLSTEHVESPHVVPIPNGTLQLEWVRGDRELELELESPQSIRYLKWHPGGGTKEEDSYPISNTDRTLELIRWVCEGPTDV